MPSDEQTRAVSFDGTTSTSTFASTERVYVYNVKKDEVMGGYLQPSAISADGKSCTLVGELSGNTTIEAGDELKLMYNLNYVEDVYYNYDDQDGSQESLLDCAEATVTVSSYTGGTLTTTANASFLPLQSMFRFKFVDENNTPLNVKKLKIESTGSDIAATYWPLDNSYGNSCIIVTPSSPTSDYLYASIRIREDVTSTELKFTVFDNNNKEYVGTRTAPTGGFKNGKYYYNTSAITLTKQVARIAPTIAWTKVYEEVEPDEYNRYVIYGPWNDGIGYFDPAEITISGNSNGYYFSIGNGGSTVHLNNLTATYNDYGGYISSDYGDLTIDINGANSITCPEAYQCIFVAGTLKLSGNGTLTVTATSDDRYGLYGNSNYKDNNNSNSDPAVLAYNEKTTVTRSARTDNGDGTYTGTYTVTTTN